jgi:hypothetical protein
MVTNDDQKVAKVEKIFSCDICNYKCNKKCNLTKHFTTVKHKNMLLDEQKMINDDQKVEKVANKSFECDCGNKYKYKQGLSRHKKLCKGEKKETVIINNQENVDYKSMFLEMINENKELRKTISEMIPKIGNNNNNNNNNNTINNKNKFNINVFLNEKCKDALSMDEFIDKIEVSMKNLLTTKEKGQVYGISNIIMENMNKLSLYERPLHCTDKKRETLYVKNQEWEKDDNKEHINKALKKVESKQLKNLNVWLKKHPNYMNNPSEQEEFAKLMSECGKSIEDGREKIIKKLCDNVYIEKVEDEAL